MDFYATVGELIYKGKLSKLNLCLERRYYINKFVTNDMLY